MERRTLRRTLWISLAAVLMLGAAGMTWSLRRHRSLAATSASTEASPGGGSPPASSGAGGMAGMPGMGPTGGATEATPAGEVPPTIQIPPERQQQIGVKFAAAVMAPARVAIRATGRVAPDETRISHVHTKVNGWIEDVFVNFVGQPVRKGQPLFTIYSPDLVASQEEYLLALRSRRELKDSPFSQVSQGSAELLAAARRRLELWDMSPAQIQALEATGRVSRTVTVFSPVSGVVTERAAYHHGRTVTPDLDLYTIVDLSRVWVLAQVYEYEMASVKVGQTAEIERPYEGGGKTLSGRVTFIAPFLDPKTRTVEVRMEFPNATLALKPESFVNVRLQADLGPRLVVPRDAVMDTGRGQYVFVDKGEGYLEPRPVRAGPEVEQGRVITDGLREGERVAAAANFILDSESRLKGAFEAMGAPSAGGGAGAAAAGPKLRIELATSPSPAKVGQNTVRVMVRDPSGLPVTEAAVDVRVFMPQMGSMAPMEAKATLQPESPGQYAGEIDVPMAWTWETTVTVRKGGQVIGTSRTSITAR